jgi:hypothetical protein
LLLSFVGVGQDSSRVPLRADRQEYGLDVVNLGAVALEFGAPTRDDIGVVRFTLDFRGVGVSIVLLPFGEEAVGLLDGEGEAEEAEGGEAAAL